MAAKKSSNSNHLKKLPSVWELFKRTMLEAKIFWRPLGGVLLVYAIVDFMFVKGFSLSGTVQDNLNGSSKISEALNSVASQFSYNALIGSAQSDTTVIIQFLLFLVASLAFIWTLRKLQNSKNVKIRDAYYSGTATLVASIIVSIILTLTMLPALIGSSVLAVALQSGSGGIEIAIVSALAFIFLILSFYLFVMVWPAFYIVSLPDSWPIKAVRSAAKLTKGRRMAILRKMFILIVFLISLIFVFLMPFALILPATMPYVVYAILFMAFGFIHTYLYLLYRSLM